MAVIQGGDDGRTTVKSSLYISHALWKRNRCQTATLRKSMRQNSIHPFFKDNRRQITTPLKSRFPYRGHTLRNSYRCQTTTLIKSTSRYRLNAGRDCIFVAVILWHISEHLGIIQRGDDGRTTVKSSLYISHALWKRNRCQTTTIRKSTIPNRGHTLRNNHRRQTRTSRKSPRPDRGHRIGNAFIRHRSRNSYCTGIYTSISTVSYLHLVVCAGDTVVIDAIDLEVISPRTEHGQQRE